MLQNLVVDCHAWAAACSCECDGHSNASVYNWSVQGTILLRHLQFSIHLFQHQLYLMGRMFARNAMIVIHLYEVGKVYSILQFYLCNCFSNWGLRMPPSSMSWWAGVSVIFDVLCLNTIIISHLPWWSGTAVDSTAAHSDVGQAQASFLWRRAAHFSQAQAADPEGRGCVAHCCHREEEIYEGEKSWLITNG